MTVTANGVRPAAEITQLAEEFHKRWEQSKPLDPGLFQMSAVWLADAIVQWAEGDGLGPLDEEDVITRIGFRLHPALQNFLRIVFLSRVRLKEDLKYLRRQAVLTIWLPEARRKGKPSFRNMILMRGASPLFCCTWVHAPQDGRWQIRMTGSVASLVDGEVRVGGDKLTRLYRNLLLPPGLTPLRRLASDSQPLGVAPSQDDPDFDAKLRAFQLERQQREAGWRENAECRQRLELRENYGVNTSSFAEAWAPRVNLENARECMEVIRVLRALRSQVAVTRAHEELSDIVAKIRLGCGDEAPTPDQLLANADDYPAFRSRLRYIKSVVDPKRPQYSTGTLMWPTFLLSYAPGHVPASLQGKTFPDSLTPGREAFPVADLKSVGDPNAVHGGTLLADFIELAKWRCQWHHNGRPASCVAYNVNVEGGGWEVLYNGDSDTTLVTDADFASARWAVIPQVIVRQHPIRHDDLTFHHNGVAFRLGDWNW